jgi:hypothetical protein
LVDQEEDGRIVWGFEKSCEYISFVCCLTASSDLVSISSNYRSIDACNVIPLTDRGGPWGYEMPRLPYLLDKMALRLSALRAGLPLPPRKIPGTHFCQRLSRPQDYSAAGRIRSTEKYNYFIGNRICDLPACATACPTD